MTSPNEQDCPPEGSTPPEVAHPRSIRSFVMRAGRTTEGQAKALSELGPRFVLPYTAQPLDFPTVFGRTAPVVLEIGFGMGDATAKIADTLPDTDFIGYPVVNADLKTRAWYSEPDAMRTMLSEYGKTVVAYIRGMTGWSRDQGLRPEGEITESGRSS